MTKKGWMFIAKGLLAAVLLIVVAQQIDIAIMLKILVGFDIRYGLAIVLIHSSVIILMAYRWQLVASGFGFEGRYFEYLRAVWVGAFFAQIGPSLITNEVSRFQFISHLGSPKSLIASQVVDRLSGQLCLLILVILMIPIYFKNFSAYLDDIPKWSFILFFLFTVSTFVLYGYFMKRVVKPGSYFFILIHQLFKSDHLLISFFILVFLDGCFTLAAAGLEAIPEPWIFAATVPLILLSLTILPLSVADWGTREAVAVFFMINSGLSTETVFAASLIYGFLFLLSACPAVLFIIFNKSTSKARAVSE